MVVITTKRGRMASKPSITYRMQLGFSQLTQNNWDLMNTAERIQYEKEIGLTSGKNYDLLGKTDVNWLDAELRAQSGRGQRTAHIDGRNVALGDQYGELPVPQG